MRTARRRIGMLLLMIGVSGGMIFTTGAGPACISFAADQALATTDFCFLFDCQNGAYGGLIDFCSLSALEQPLFTDCPQFIGGTLP